MIDQPAHIYVYKYNLFIFLFLPQIFSKIFLFFAFIGLVHLHAFFFISSFPFYQNIWNKDYFSLF